MRESFATQLRRSPVTALVLLATFIVFAVTWAGDNFSAIRWLSFVDFRIDGERIYLTYLDATLGSGQWWRLITPMLIHFGWLHLALTAPSVYLWLGLPLVMRQHGWSGTAIGLFQLAGLPALIKFCLLYTSDAADE